MDPIRVFLCDDDPGLRELLHLRLPSEADIEVVGEAPDGRAAIEGIAELRPDVVLLDIAMPRLSGLEAMDDIHAVAPETGIIVFTGLPGAEAAVRRHGADDFLRKTDSLDYVILAIRRVALRRRAAHPRGPA